MIRSLVVTSILCASSILAAPAAAGDNDEGAAAAESLFQEARKLMDEKRDGDGCPKFAASQKIAPAIGTLLNLADCYEKNNQFASAYLRFREAAALAQQRGRANREQTARERAERLEPRVNKLSILSHGPVDVKLDGNLLEQALVGTPLPVDPGKHTIEASAKGKRSFVTTVDLGEKSKSSSVLIPELEDEAKDSPAAAIFDDETKSVTKEEPRGRPHSTWSTRQTLGVIAAGVGVVGLGVGSYMGLKTSSTWKEAQTHCTGLECDQRGVDLASQAKTAGNIATVGILAGTALLIGGTVVFLTAPIERKPDPARTAIRFGVGPGNILATGTF